MDLTRAGIALSVIGIGLNLAVVLPMKPATKRIVGRTGIVLAVLGVGMLSYDFLLGSRPGDAGTPAAITQDHPVDSPINPQSQTMTNSPEGIQIMGDNNVVNKGPQPWRITKEDEFKAALRAVGPVTIGLEAFEDRDALLLYGQLYKVLKSSEWTANERGTVRGQSWVGVHIVIQKDKAVPQGAIEMVKQLRANGIASGLVPEQSPTPFEKVAFIVRIGFKPPDNNK